MILSLRGKPSSRSSFQASYTLSRAMDYPEANTRFDQDGSGGGPRYDNGGGNDIPVYSAYSSYWADADWDVRNRLSFSGNYTLPGLKNGRAGVLASGWEVSAIAVAQSGTPFWVINNLPLTSGGDYNADGNNWDIPNKPSADFTGAHSRQAYIRGLFTAADFPAPAAGAEGNLPRNIYRNPGYFQVDASLLKNNRLPWLGEQAGLQLRVDFLNLFNHVNLGNVDRFMADGSNFGKVVSALPARQLELQAKFIF